MLSEQEGPDKVKWSPSNVIARLGKEIDNEESVYYWATRYVELLCASHP
jgi:deoxyhypusine synthase